MAINKRLSRPWTRNREEVTYTGKWAIGATGAVGAKTGGVDLTLTRTGVGLYTLALADTPAAVLHVDPIRVTNVGFITTLTHTTTGATFRTGVYASPQTAADPANGEFLTFQATVLRSLTK